MKKFLTVLVLVLVAASVLVAAPKKKGKAGMIGLAMPNSRRALAEGRRGAARRCTAKGYKAEVAYGDADQGSRISRSRLPDEGCKLWSSAGERGRRVGRADAARDGAIVIAYDRLITGRRL
jgi:putative multiple sugar transport system substrate-binding protein